MWLTVDPLAIFKTDPDTSELRGLKAEYDGLASANQERLTRMRLFRDENSHERDPATGGVSDQTSDYGRRKAGADDQPARHAISVPLGKALNVKHAYRIAGQLPDCIVDERDETPQERHRSNTMEKIVWAIIRASSGQTSIASAAWDSSEIGAACFDLYFDAAMNMPRFRRVDPEGILEVQGVDDPHDFQRVYRTWKAPLRAVESMYRDQFFRGQPVDVEGLRPNTSLGKVEQVLMVQMCDKKRVIRFACGGNGEVVGLYEFEHNYGFVPYVVIPNIGPYEDVWGWADYEFVRGLVTYLPFLLSREADQLRAVTGGAYMEKGTGANATTVQNVIRRGGVLASKREGTVDPIQAPDMPQFHETHSGRAMDFFKMVGFVPDAAWGLPGSGSGSDRGLQLQPLLEYTGMKQLNWDAGLSRLFGYAYRMIESQTRGKATYRGSMPRGSGATTSRLSFAMQLGPDVDPLQEQGTDPTGLPFTVVLPRTPRELFDGDYSVRFNWRNRIDPDDPSYVMSEVNKFSQGLQSMQTTLENLGVPAPEEEMRRLEAEAERFPWVNQGLVSMLIAQNRSGQGVGGGGSAPDMAGGVAGAVATMTGAGGGESGALNADAAASALGPSGAGTMYGSA